MNVNNMTKQEALNKIEELKKFVNEVDTKEQKVVGIAIKNRFTGEIIFQSSKTTIKEAITEKGGVDLSNADLTDADLRNADLSYVDLTDANLSNTNLSNANLSNADLTDANLSNADLSYADLRNADLTDADLTDADLRNANLSGVEMQNVKFYGRGGKKILKKEQIPDFLLALGFIIEN